MNFNNCLPVHLFISYKYVYYFNNNNFNLLVLVRNNFISGRIPLTLPCSHVVCEECCIYMSKIKAVNCVVCKNTVNLEEVPINVRLVFPVDRFILGSLVKHNLFDKNRIPVADRIGRQFIVPAGSSLQMKDFKRGRNMKPIAIEASTASVSASKDEKQKGMCTNIYLFLV